jgi:hypothetical protein
VIQFEPIRHDAGIRRWGRKRYARSLRCEISGTDSYWPAFAADSANRPKQGKVPAWPEHRNTIVKKRGAAARWRPASLIPKRGQIFSTWRGSMKSLRLRRKPKQTDHRAPANTHRAGTGAHHLHRFRNQQRQLIGIEAGLARAHFEIGLDTKDRPALTVQEFPFVP